MNIQGYLPFNLGFPGGASGKEPACQCKRRRRRALDPWVGKIPWRRPWQPIPAFLLGKISWTEEPIGSQRVRHYWSNLARTHHTFYSRFFCVAVPRLAGLNLGPRQWKRWVLITGSPGNSLKQVFLASKSPGYYFFTTGFKGKKPFIGCKNGFIYIIFLQLFISNLQRKKKKKEIIV